MIYFKILINKKRRSLNVSDQEVNVTDFEYPLGFDKKEATIVCYENKCKKTIDDLQVKF